MQLLLFDIDGTLLRSNGAGKATIINALEDTFGTAGPWENYLMAGKTDPLIIGDLLGATGKKTAEIEEKLPQIYERMMSERQPQKKGARCRYLVGVGGSDVEGKGFGEGARRT